MQTIPKGRPVPVIRRTLRDSHNNSREMGGQTVIPDNPRNLDDSNRQAHLQTAHIKAAIKTPEEERRRIHMSSPSPNNVYSGQFSSPSPSPIVRPQSAMGLTSPTGHNNPNTISNNNNSPSSANNYINNYNNSYGKAVQYQRPPSSLGIRDMPRSNYDKPPTMHQHSRSFGDGITAEQVFTDRIPPRDVNAEAYQRRNQVQEQNKASLPPRGNQSGPRGSYNPYYASNLDLNSRPSDSHIEKPTHDNTSYNDVQDSGARMKSSTPAASSQDLRSAWQRLYGQNGDSPGRRPSLDHVTHNNQTQRSGEMDYQKSPRQATRSPFLGADNNINNNSNTNNNMQNPTVRMVPRGKQVAGPMVTPFTKSGRQSPPGQCSANQNLPQNFNTPNHPPPASFSSPKAAIKSSRTTPHHDSPSLGPAAKYPDPDIGLRRTLIFDDTHTISQSKTFLTPNDHQTQPGRKSFGGNRDLGGLYRHHSPHYTHNDAYCSDTEIDADDEPDLLPTDSIFDYVKSDSEEEEQPLAGVHQIAGASRRGSNQNIDVLSVPRGEKGSNVVNLREAPKPNDKRLADLKTSNYARSRSLEDVRESGDEVSNVSFDIENTFLMVDPSDQSEMGTLRSKNSDVKTKLNRLEGMYAKVMKTLETRSPKESRGRRWSIGSSDTNSIRHQVHQHSKHGRSSNQRMSNREIKSVNKRFQRLESHVITLARSIAHISSELRTQNTMSREIENVKREIQELKISGTNNGGDKDRKRRDFDKYRGYNHPLTNPKQVNKLTRFFGQEPSWLEIFLTRLGYEQYVKNFHQEHIGMMELPYMTDDQLKSIGIPMGPRTRILQESQMCFKDDNFNIYIV